MLMPLPGRKQWKHWTRRGGCIQETSSGDFFSFLVRWIFSLFCEVDLFWSGGFLFLFLFWSAGFSLSFFVIWIPLFFCQVDFSFLLLDFSVLYSVFDIREDNEGFFTMVSCVIQIIKFYRFCHLVNLLHNCRINLAMSMAMAMIEMLMMMIRWVESRRLSSLPVARMSLRSTLRRRSSRSCRRCRNIPHNHFVTFRKCCLFVGTPC